MEAAERTSRAPQRDEDFLRALLTELERVVNKHRAAWTVNTRLPVIPHAAQLTVLARLLLKGADEHWGDVFKHREKLETLLAKVHHEAKREWEAGLKKTSPAARNKYLNAAKPIAAAGNKAVDFAARKIGLSTIPLSTFTANVQDTLAELVGKVSTAIEMKVGPGTKAGAAGQVPGAVYGAITLGVLAGGLAGRREMTAKEVAVARIAARLGSLKDETGGPEPKEVRRLRKTLKELGTHLPEQRA